MKMNTDKIYAEKIAGEYAPKETTKIVALKKLDAKAKRPANIISFTLGTLSTLVFGAGMCFSMGVIGGGDTGSMILGIALGILGGVGVSVNYPIYKRLIEGGKKKYGSDILRLAKEISEG